MHNCSMIDCSQLAATPSRDHVIQVTTSKSPCRPSIKSIGCALPRYQVQLNSRFCRSRGLCSIQTQSYDTFMKINHEIISTVALI